MSNTIYVCEKCGEDTTLPHSHACVPPAPKIKNPCPVCGASRKSFDPGPPHKVYFVCSVCPETPSDSHNE